MITKYNLQETVAIFLVKEDEFHFFKHLARRNVFKKCIFLFAAPYEVLPGYQTLNLSTREFTTISAYDLFKDNSCEVIQDHTIKNSSLLGEQRYLRPFHKRFYWDVDKPSPQLQIDLALNITRKAYQLAQKFSNNILVFSLTVADLFRSTSINFFNSNQVDVIYLVHSHFKNHHIPYTNNINQIYKISHEISPINSLGISWFPICALNTPISTFKSNQNSLSDNFTQRKDLSTTYEIMFRFSLKRIAQLLRSYYVSILQYVWSNYCSPKECHNNRLIKYFKEYTSLSRPLMRVFTSANDFRTRILIQLSSSSRPIAIPKHIDYVCVLLHSFPEATLIGEMNGHADEREWIFSIWKSLPITTHLYVFEHPAMSWSGERPLNFYKFLSMFHNVHVIHTQKYKGVPISVLESAKQIYSFAGSIALEAAVQGLLATTVTSRPYSYVKNIEEYQMPKTHKSTNQNIEPSRYFELCASYPDFDLDTIKWNHKSIDHNSLALNVDKLLSYL